MAQILHFEKFRVISGHGSVAGQIAEVQHNGQRKYAAGRDYSTVFESNTDWLFDDLEKAMELQTLREDSADQYFREYGTVCE